MTYVIKRIVDREMPIRIVGEYLRYRGCCPRQPAGSVSDENWHRAQPGEGRTKIIVRFNTGDTKICRGGGRAAHKDSNLVRGHSIAVLTTELCRSAVTVRLR